MKKQLFPTYNPPPWNKKHEKIATGKLRVSFRDLSKTTRPTTETMTLTFNRKRKDPEYPDA